MDRHGTIRDKSGQRFGNVEPHLTYPKLIRSGRLIKGLKTRSTSTRIELHNSTPYAQTHELGGSHGAPKVLTGSRIRNASSVKLGGNIQARPFMRPSIATLNTPYNLLRKKLTQLGWGK